MSDVTDKLFDDLCVKLSEIEARFQTDVPNLPDEDDELPDLRLVPSDTDWDNENDQTGDVSGKIAALNDRFRQNPSAEDSNINGEWFLGDDVTALPPPTKAAIKRYIAEHDDFADCPTHDRGAFIYEAKSATYNVAWMIRVFADDQMQADATHPEDPSQSFRLLMVSLLGDDGEEG